MSTPSPPDPFDAETEVLTPGTLLYRVDSPPVPVLYAADTERAAVAESLLHDIPLSGGYLTWNSYSRVVMGRVRITAELRLADLCGLDLRPVQRLPSGRAVR